MARPAQDEPRRPVADVVSRQHQLHNRSLRIFRFALRPAFGPDQPRALQIARVRQALRSGKTAPGLSRAHAALRTDVTARDRLRTVEARRLPLRDGARLSMGAGLQVQRLRPIPVAVSRPRRGAAQRCGQVIRAVESAMTKGVPGLLSALAIAVLIAAFPAVAADPSKVLHVAFVAPENGFDPQATGDLYSNYVNRQIFDSLYRYDYLARPYKVIPNTAAGLPEISSDGLTWTIKVRPGIYFTDDAAFKGKKRELTAADYVYSWKRLLDPKLRSINAQIFDDRLFGAKAAIEAAKKTGKFDYDAAFEGAQAVDRYTIRLKLNCPAYDLLGDLTASGAAAVAREVVTAYGDPSGWVMEHPVGTGPYYLKSWRRAQQVVLEANPAFRELRFPESSQADDRAMLAEMRGKK
ncbi:MAG: hypothetical protein E6H46_06230, partial [Betaproteobacteria bacterium]